MLLYLSKNNNHLIIVPCLSITFKNHIKSNNINNIIDANDYFNSTIDDTGKNVFCYVYLSDFCDYVIYYDVGRCFSFVHENFTCNNKKIYIDLMINITRLQIIPY
jgi:hypothetical protein